MKALALTLALTISGAAAIAGEDPVSLSPGYVDFTELNAEYGEPRVMINLGTSLLALVGSMKHEDPMAEKTLKSLQSVRVHVYDTAGDTRPAAERMQQVNQKMVGLDWEQVVRVREPKDQVDIYIKHNKERIQGLVVMALDGEEAVFVNVLGDIDPRDVGDVVAQIDMVDELDLDVDVEL